MSKLFKLSSKYSSNNLIAITNIYKEKTRYDKFKRINIFSTYINKYMNNYLLKHHRLTNQIV